MSLIDLKSKVSDPQVLDRKPVLGLVSTLKNALDGVVLDDFSRHMDCFVAAIRRDGDLLLRLSLWNGRQWMLCPKGAEKVHIRLLSRKAIPYLLEPSLSNLGKAYVEGLIDVEGELVDLIAMAHKLAGVALNTNSRLVRTATRYVHSRHVDKANISHHYDVSNEFYQLWLDSEMVYSCAYFEQGGESLAQAQIKKLDHVLKKVRARPNDRLLDVGCGWGALVIRAAQQYGCHCTGITLSEQQYVYARERVAALGLEGRVEILLKDYRDVSGEYDRITSVGMFEHVGVANLPGYFRDLNSLLSAGGVMLNHGITSSDADGRPTPFGGGDFIEKYVFPRGELAHIGTVLTAMKRGGLEVQDVESLRRHYALTLAYWSDAFEAKSEVIRAIIGEKKYRVWRVYLMGSAYAFDHDEISVFQVVCSKAGLASSNLPYSRRHMYE
jgi:cyclopropane-fatty-acyl-phospholipid synthase